MKKTTGNALVVGAGIAGIRSAMDLAENGHRVTLIDNAPHMGGILSRLDYQFPSDGCGMCRMLPHVDRDQSSQYCMRRGLSHRNIRIMLSTELKALEGEPGQYTARLNRKDTCIDPEKCIGCGACSTVCPETVPDAFNLGQSTRKAVYLPVPHAVPNIYTIDTEACTLCGECVKVCPTEAIILPEDQRSRFSILVVDDELIVRDSMKEWLSFEGFSVEMAESGEAALEQLENASFDLVFLDIKMSGMDGTTALERIRELNPEQKVVMMTAYATVETAVKTLKQGALEYVVKPFEPETAVQLAQRLYHETFPDTGSDVILETGAVILAHGTSTYAPDLGKNTFGYKVYPDVVTAPEFERLLSGTGPDGGKLLRPSDKTTPRRIAWIQCVGSRGQNDPSDAPYCSAICCMHALKEAVLVRKHSGGAVETVIYYIDMRCWGKTHDSYRREAEAVHGVILKRAQPHTVRWDEKEKQLRLFIAGMAEDKSDESFDMVVLSTGVKPAAGSSDLWKRTGLAVDEWGVPLPEAEQKGPEGVFAAGSAAGPMDIQESLIHASSAGLKALTLLNRTAKEPDPADEDTETDAETAFRDVSTELPRAAVVLCNCRSGDVSEKLSAIDTALSGHPRLSACLTADALCTREGWEKMAARLGDMDVNRVIIGACLPALFTENVRQLSRAMGLSSVYFEVVDLFNVEKEAAVRQIKMALSRIAHQGLPATTERPVEKRALVVGAGIAGMTAALSMADNGVDVLLVEQEKAPGGNLNWLTRHIDGTDYSALLETTTKAVTDHPGISLMTGARIMDSFGRAGGFVTTIDTLEGDARVERHGAVIMATGAHEAGLMKEEAPANEALISQRDLETLIHQKDEKLEQVRCTVMVQCVECRDDIKGYCSRVCCPTAVKHARALKETCPDMQIYILYRDMMMPGSLETLYTAARKEGIVFIPYTRDNPPRISSGTDGEVVVSAWEPILEARVEISAQLVVRATGMVPEAKGASGPFAHLFDPDGFFQSADEKFRPVDSMTEGFFGCGTALGPRNVPDAVRSAQAAAVRAMHLLGKETLMPSAITADVKTSICSLCELCIPACPYDARSINPETRAIEVHPAMCQGCGACSAVCPSSAAFVSGFQDRQMLDIIDSAIGV